MDKLAIELFNESKETLEIAKSHLRQNEFEEVISLLHNCAEKAISALIIHKTKKIPKITFKLIELAKKADLPEEYNKILKKVTGKEFTISYATYMYDQTESHKNELKHMIYGIDEILDYIEEELED